MMELVLVFALSAIVAMLFNWGQPRLAAVQNARIQSLQGSYFGKTLLTTVTIFAAILVAGFLFKSLGERVSVGGGTVV